MSARTSSRPDRLAGRGRWILMGLVLTCGACAGPTIDQDGGLQDCWTCHGDRYQTASAPDHVAANYPKDCSRCHSTDAWRPAAAEAHAPGGSFPLTGGHAGVACSACHGDPFEQVDDATCVGCHLDDYQATSDPDHQAQGLPTTCEQCHTIAGWKPARAGEHEADGSFPLTGGHAGLACSACHGDPFEQVDDATCVACHLDDFQATSNPDHQSLGLPTTCDECHTTAGWSPADFTAFHTFPLSTGRHTGLACSACHPAGNDWADFSCLTCHEHDRARMDDVHLGEVSGYQYDSQACYRCHPTGVAEGD